MQLSQFKTLPFSIVLIIFVFQSIGEHLAILSNQMLWFLQTVGILPLISLMNMILNKGIFPISVVCFLYYCFLVHAKIIQNLSTIVFLSTSFYLLNLFKLLLGELAPNMSSLLSKNPLKMYYCSVDFGMPSTSIFMTVCYFFLIRRNFFVVKTQNDCAMNRVSKSAEQIEDKFVFPERRFKFKDCQRFIVDHECQFNLFNIVSMSILSLTVLIRILSGGNTLSQSLLSVVLAAIWSTFYYNFIEMGLKSFHRDLIFRPTARKATVMTFTLFHIVAFLLNWLLYFLRRAFSSQTELAVIQAAFGDLCHKNELWLADINFYLALSIFFPLFVVWMLYLTPFRTAYYDAYLKRVSFVDLTKQQKILRVGAWIVGFTGMIGLYYLNNYVIRTFFWDLFWMQCAIYLFFLFCLAFFLVLGCPFVFMRLGVLLKNEYIFNVPNPEDEESNKDTSSNPKTIVAKTNKKKGLQDFNKEMTAVDIQEKESNEKGQKISKK